MKEKELNNLKVTECHDNKQFAMQCIISDTSEY